MQQSIGHGIKYASTARRAGVSLEDAAIRRIADMYEQPDIFAAATRIRAQAEKAAIASGGGAKAASA